MRFLFQGVWRHLLDEGDEAGWTKMATFFATLQTVWMDLGGKTDFGYDLLKSTVLYSEFVPCNKFLK